MSFEKLAELKQQLAAEAKANKTQVSKQSNQVDPIVHVIARLQKHFPKAIPKTPAPKVPLKIGILDDLLARSKDIGASEIDLKNALQTWCKTRRYLVSTKVGAQRVDLDGNMCGEVQAHEATHARMLEKNILNNQSKSC